jgi:hypothetical protein
LQFQNGMATGLLTLVDDSIVKGRVRDIIRKGTVNLSSGIPTGDMAYEGQHRGRSVRGQFDDQGRFHGHWSISDSDSSGIYKEQRTYRHGFLTQLHLTLNDSVIHDITYTDVIRKLDLLASGDTLQGYSVGPRAFGVVFDDGFAPHSPEQQAQTIGNMVIERAFHMLFGQHTEPFAYTGIDSIQKGSTRRFIYTYTQDEEDALLRSAILIDSLVAASSRYLENKMLMINRQKSDSLAFSYGWLMTLQSKLYELETAVSNLRSDNFRYQDRANYYRNGIACAADMDSVHYDFDGEERVKVVLNDACVTSGQDVIVNIHRFLMVLNMHMTNTALYLDSELSLLMREQQLIETDERILALTDSVFIQYTGGVETDSDIGSMGIDQNRYASPLHQAVFRNLMVHTRKRMMQEYSNMSSFADKQEKGNQILELLNTLLDADSKLLEVNSLPEKIDESYTTFEFNPYMGRHDIKVRKKKWIYDRTMTDLWPHMIRQIDGEKDFNRLLALINGILRISDRLVDLSKLSDSETSKLERKLRSETDPERIRKLIDP